MENSSEVQIAFSAETVLVGLAAHTFAMEFDTSVLTAARNCYYVVAHCAAQIADNYCVAQIADSYYLAADIADNYFVIAEVAGCWAFVGD